MTTATTEKPSKNKTSITPLGDRVLVRRVEETETIRGGIHIPDSAREKPQEAEVLALGPGRRDKHGKRIAFEVKAGDRVLVAKFGGTEVQRDGETLLLLREDDILGVLR